MWRHLFNMKVLGLAMLAAVFFTSLARVLWISSQSGEGPLGSRGPTVVRLVHWQLEPGYRQALQRVIDEYNALPHVQAANVQVRQDPVTEKVYNQFLNVHLLSGTAPDIVEKGMASMAGGTYTAKYFEPLGEAANAPNPYNARAYLPKDMDSAQSLFLAEAPWRETFIDGMRGGWDDQLQNYYAVPSSFSGGMRLYYNHDLIQQAKALAHEAMRANPRPTWLVRFLAEGWVTEDAPFQKWLARVDPPDTLGRLLLVCASVRQIAQESQRPLVPIAGSSYSDRYFTDAFLVPFTSFCSERLDRDLDSHISAMESYAGLRQGVWSFEEPHVRAYHDCLTTLSAQFSAGYLGLDREQANRRFISGDAAMIATGGWDASSLFRAAEGWVPSEGEQVRPDQTVTVVDGERRVNFRFKVGVIAMPLPGPGEKWSQWTSYKANEAQANAGAPYAIYQRSRHKEWALDFLHFFTSYRINERFNREAGWVPCVAGTTPTPKMAPFMPDPAGLSPGSRLAIRTSGYIGDRYDGWLRLMMTGEVSYDALAQTMRDAAADPRNGLNRLWYTIWEQELHQHRNQERMLAVQQARQLLLDAPDAAGKYRRGLLRSVLNDNAAPVRAHWRELHPQVPFPAF